MNTTNACAAMMLLALSTVTRAAGLAEQDAWTRTFDVTAAPPQLVVSNIWGDVRVTPGEAGRITVAVTERRTAPDQARFDRSLQKYGLDIASDAAGVSLIVGEPARSWQGRNDCDGCRAEYQFDIRVPPETKVDVSTVMDGTVDVSGVSGAVSASNVNGPVRVAGLRECKEISSVNGEVDIGFDNAPLRDCRIETINGNVTLGLPVGTGLDMSLDLFNGEVTSELPVGPLALPATVEETVDEGRRRYRIEQLAGMRLGAGGPMYRIASMNGDLRIQKLN